MNRKGTAQDFLTLAIILCVMSVVILVVFKLSNEFNNEVQSSDRFNEEGKIAFNKINSMYPGVVDNSFLLLTIGLAIVAFILAALVRVHPIFIGLFVLMLAFIIFISAILSNIYQSVAQATEMVAVANKLVFISQIMNTLPFIVGIFGGVLAIVMYKTWRTSIL